MSHNGQASASDGSLVSRYAGGTSGLEPGNRNRSDFHSIHLSLFTSSYAERSLKPAREHSEKASQPRWVPGRKLRLVVAGRWVIAIPASSNSIGHHSTQKAGSYHLQALDGLPEGSFAGALYVHDQDHSVGLRSKYY